MDQDINSRNSDNYVDINGKPVKRVTNVDVITGEEITPATETTQLQNQSFLEGINYVLSLLNQTAQSLSVVDSSQRQRIVVEAISGTGLGQGVTAGQTLNPPNTAPTITSSTVTAQPVYQVGMDWRESNSNLSNIAYNQMLDRISF